MNIVVTKSTNYRFNKGVYEILSSVLLFTNNDTLVPRNVHGITW